MPDADNIMVWYTQSDKNDLDNNLEGRVPSFPLLHFGWTLLNQMLQYQECLAAGNALSTFCNRC